MGEMVTVQAVGGSMPAWLSLPEVPNGYGVVLGMAVWGLNSDLRDYADFLAELGYAVIAPNLFWRARRDHAMEYDMSRLAGLGPLMKGLTDEQAVDDLASAAMDLRRRAACARIGVVGWCYGGRIACLAGLGHAFDAVVAFYPTTLELRLDIARRLQVPTSLHLAEIEQYATREDALEQLKKAFSEDPNVELHVYRGASHGFAFSASHPHHHPIAARLANSRTVLFLSDRLLRNRTES